MAGNLPKSKTPYVKTFKCPQCAGVIIIRGGAQSLVAVCSACKSVVDVSHPYLKIIQKAQLKTTAEPLISLGSRGKLHGVIWEVIGYMRRMDVGSHYAWEEYLLFNPFQGYRWLTQADGHWNYVVMSKDKPIADVKVQNDIHYLGRKYKLFHKGNARVTDVLGEFYWRVKVGDTVEVADFIYPPEILSFEESKEDSEQSWSIAEYIEPEALQEAFKPERKLPVRKGIAPNQPSHNKEHFKPIMTLWSIFIIALILVQFIHIKSSSRQTAFQETFHYEYGVLENGIKKSVVTAPFELKNGLTNITVDLSAPVSNTWLSIGGDLVNEKTGETYSFNNTVEQYSGVDGGEYWMDGSNQMTELLSSIPEGTYHLDFQASGAGPGETSRYVQLTPAMDYSLSIRRGIPIWSNFLWALALLSILPLWVWWRSHLFEVNRWSKSDYSPYSSE